MRAIRQYLIAVEWWTHVHVGAGDSTDYELQVSYLLVERLGADP